MAKCEHCGNDYDKAFESKRDGETHVFNSLQPGLAGEALPLVKAATLLIVGERDEEVLHLTERAYAQLKCEKFLAGQCPPVARKNPGEFQ